MSNTEKKRKFSLSDIVLVNTQYVYLLMMVILSLLVTMQIMFDSLRPLHFRWLPLLPFSFAIGSFIGFKAYDMFLKKISVTVIIITYFIRMVLLPLFMCLGNYADRFSYNRYFPEVLSYAEINNVMNIAIALMCIELIIVFVALSFVKLQKGGFFSKFHTNIKTDATNSSELFKLFIVAIVGYVAFVLFMYPQMGNYVQFFIVNTVEADIKNFLASIEMKETVPSVFYWSYIFIVNLVQVFVPVILIGWFYRLFGFKYRRFGLFMAFVVIAAVFAFMTPQKATSIQLALVLLLVVCMLYPDIMRLRIPLLILAIGLFTVMALLLKSGSYKGQGERGAEFIAHIVNAYFGGPKNVAVAICLPHEVPFKTFAADILRSIPFLKYFFKEWTFTPELFNRFILGDNAPPMKIIPLVGQGKFYFGYLFAPFFSLIPLYLSVFFERLAEQTSMLIKKYIYLYITFVVSMVPVMYNLNIMMDSLFSLVICLVLMKMADVKLLMNGKIHY